MQSEAISYSTDLPLGQTLTPAQIGNAVLRGTAVIAIAIDMRGIVTFMNAAAELALGYKAEEIVGKATPLLWHDREEVKAHAATLGIDVGNPEITLDFPVLLQQDPPPEVEKEWTFVRRDGSRFYGLLTSERIVDDQGKLVGFMGTIMDVSRVRERERALANREIFFDTVIRNITEGVITINADGVIQTYNPASERLFGYRSDEVLGQNITILMPEGDRTRHAYYLNNQMKNGDRRLVGVEREVIGQRKDGSVFPLELIISRFEMSGEVIFIGLLRDVSERKRNIFEREQMIARLTESNAEYERFAYVASHDMQEPLRALCSFSDLLKDECKEVTADGQLYLSLIRDAAARMQAMVVDILEYARFGREASRYDMFSAAVEYEHVLKNLKTSIEACRAQVTCNTLPSIRGNPVQFCRLLQNLIGNAVKFRRDDVVPTVHVSAEDKPDFWLFSVKDNGIGIEEKDMEEIFQPFKRLHPRQKYAGNGLGLSICRKIVENHAGEMWGISTPWQGSIFYFTWPK